MECQFGTLDFVGQNQKINESVKLHILPSVINMLRVFVVRSLAGDQTQTSEIKRKHMEGVEKGLRPTNRLNPFFFLLKTCETHAQNLSETVNYKCFQDPLQ